VTKNEEREREQDILRRSIAAAESQAMSFDLDEQDTREDVRRIAAASESFAESERKLVDFLARTDEDVRQARHHDVLCLVLKHFIGSTGPASVCRGQAAEGVVRDARFIADLAYPPPKAEP